MAKAQVKKTTAAAKGGRKPVARKVVARGKSAVSRTAVKRASKPPKPVKKAAKPAAKPAPKAAPKKVAKPAPKPVAAKAKTLAKVAKKVAKAVVAKVAPSKPAAPKPVAVKPAAVKPAAVKPAASPAPAPRPLAAAPPPRPIARPVAEADKKRVRRPRTRVQSSGAPAAAWLSTTKPRPASFIPAPPRAEAPSAIAAPPASSDRLIRPEDVSDIAVRTVPVRVDIEQGGGKFFLSVIPQEVTLRPGEGIEWDFRYLGGADISVAELTIELDKPTPFLQTIFRTKKPGAARPHRQMSGAVQASAVGRRIEYTIIALTPFKTEVARARLSLSVVA